METQELETFPWITPGSLVMYGRDGGGDGPRCAAGGAT